MSITFHKAVADTGGAIGTAIDSGVINTLLPEITLLNQSVGATISRKFYIKNSFVNDIAMTVELDSHSIASFDAILFESSGDAQVVGDLTGSETDESPISVTISGSGHKSFWVQVDVPASSTVTDVYNTIDIKYTY